MSADSFPHEDLRRRLAEIGIPAERHGMRELANLLPAKLEQRPYDEATADAIAEVLLYLAGRNVLSLPAASAAPELAWGERRCRPYRSEEDLGRLVASFFAEGLRRNERCLWIAPRAIASQILRHANGYARDLQQAGDQLEIVDMLENWQREEDRALTQGYSGLRISADAALHGAGMHAAIAAGRVKMLCTHRE